MSSATSSGRGASCGLRGPVQVRGGRPHHRRLDLGPPDLGAPALDPLELSRGEPRLGTAFFPRCGRPGAQSNRLDPIVTQDPVEPSGDVVGHER